MKFFQISLPNYKVISGNWVFEKAVDVKDIYCLFQIETANEVGISGSPFQAGSMFAHELSTGEILIGWEAYGSVTVSNVLLGDKQTLLVADKNVSTFLDQHGLSKKYANKKS